MRDETVFIRPGSDKYHASRSCAGQHALPTFPEFVATEKLRPCALCEPPAFVQCDVDGCTNTYQDEAWLKRHKYQDHVRGTMASGPVSSSDVDYQRLDKKARGELDD